MILRFALTLLFVLPWSLTALGQIELSYEIRKSAAGAINPEILPSGRIVMDKDSKLSSSDLAIIKAASSESVRIVILSGSQKADLKAYKELIDPVSKVKTSWYELVGEGSYKILALSRVNEAWDRTETIVIGPQPSPDPDPNPPIPPDPPTPVPVTSFRVIFVKESGQTLNADQTAIAGAKAIRDYLTAKTTPEGGFSGWREYDPQQNVSNEESKMKALWAAAKSSITTVPCLIIEVNGKVKIVSYPKNVAEAIKLLKDNGGN